MEAGAARRVSVAASGGPPMRRIPGSEGCAESPDRRSNLLVLLALVFLFALQIAHAGGPRWVGGSSYFDSSVKGQPIVWANGQVTYRSEEHTAELQSLRHI